MIALRRRLGGIVALAAACSSTPPAGDASGTSSESGSGGGTTTTSTTTVATTSADGTGSSTSQGTGDASASTGDSTQSADGSTQTASDTTAGDTTAGDTTAGDTTAGDTTVGSTDTTVGSTDTTAGSTDGSTSASTGATQESTGGMPGCPYAPVPGATAFAVEQIASGFDRPVLALGQPDQPDRLWVVEQGGDVRILEPGEAVAPADAALHVDVQCANNNTIGCEQGLLGFAFHPDFPTDGRIYVAYTPAGDSPTRVSEFMTDGNVFDPMSERIVIEAAQPFSNHNGGMIAFGPTDGWLYVALGDGGNADDDPQMTGQNPAYILGKLLRIGIEPDGAPDDPIACAAMYCDVLGPFDYTVPPDNPFVGDPSFAPEIWAWGFRNPWRFSIDPPTGELWLGDVGQNLWEEVDLVEPGMNYGWSDMEGNHCFNDATCDENAAPNQENADGLVAPVDEYSHAQGCSVTGGAVYRSCESPDQAGTYLYGDYCSGDLYGLGWDGAAVDDLGVVVNDLPNNTRILGTGWNAWGDVYFTTVIAPFGLPIQDGLVYRVVPG